MASCGQCNAPIERDADMISHFCYSVQVMMQIRDSPEGWLPSAYAFYENQFEKGLCRCIFHCYCDGCIELYLNDLILTSTTECKGRARQLLSEFRAWNLHTEICEHCRKYKPKGELHSSQKLGEQEIHYMCKACLP